MQPGGNVNIYGPSPCPRTTLAYAASTANDISQPASDHLSRLVHQWPQGTRPSPAHYAGHLDQLRARIRIAYGLGADTDIVFAPSGTGLEYIALHLTGAMHGKPVTNILVGPEEVGSGCGLAAGGRFFAHETACLPLVEKGGTLAGLGDSEVRLVPLRDGFAVPHASARIASAISELADRAAAAGRQPLAHVIHGSKNRFGTSDARRHGPPCRASWSRAVVGCRCQ